DRPQPPRARVRSHPLTYAGEDSEKKRSRLGQDLEAKGLDAAFLSAPDSIAWLLNIRGGDVPHVPLALSFAVLYRGGAVDWFVDPEKLPNDESLGLGDGIKIHSPAHLEEAVSSLKAKRIGIDPSSIPEWIRTRMENAGVEIVRISDPCLLPKACKNAIERDGTRAAHRRDGLALTRFLCWLDHEVTRGRQLTELDLVGKLQEFRQAGSNFRDLSFETIAGSGPNGAIVHYRVTEETNRELSPGDLFLLDSGAQYLDGTTDVTRTIAIGDVGGEEKRAFTLVLKGHIALARARFPKGTTGSQLDSLARYPLWLEGMDFDHGTGHGVGSYLSVHEGPQRISKIPNSVALEPGMILSNEPGYYKNGRFGIRIENLVLVKDEGESPDGRGMRAFETLTLAPIDLRLVITDLLSEEERNWVNSYHAQVRESHLPALDAEEKDWLRQVTAPL
ncbi:MAG: aminopeptidase family protein P, partial [Kiloniellales bacterium]|nr:aminopeptidase family protein P [Kiloniellales bacterium]